MNIYGASGHGKVIIDIIRSINGKITSVYDDNKAVNKVYGFDVSHELTLEILNCGTVLAIGDNSIRKKVAASFKGNISKALVHASSEVSESAEISNGTVVMANSSINADVKIGSHCIINTGAVVEHDCILSDYVHISPNSALAGNVEIGEGTHVGIGAVVIPGIKIGSWVKIGAGAVIINDIPDFAVVVGNPGKIIKYTK